MTALETGEALGRITAEIFFVLLGIYLGNKYIWGKKKKEVKK